MAGGRAEGASFNVWAVIQTVMAGLLLGVISWSGVTVLGHGNSLSTIDARLDSELAYISGSSVRDTVVRLVQSGEFCSTKTIALETKLDGVSKEHRALIVELARSLSEVKSDCNRLHDRVEYAHGKGP